MARGLTLEGLTTSLFLRTSDSPLADTQMQMQRWFGYRGNHIELCRVFAPQDQIDFFTEYHDVDEALRNVIAEAMQDDSVIPSPVVLQGRTFLATGKIANLGNKPLHPGRKPFIPLINRGDHEDPNVRLVADTFANKISEDVTAGNRVRGRILTEPLSLRRLLRYLTGCRSTPTIQARIIGRAIFGPRSRLGLVQSSHCRLVNTSTAPPNPRAVPPLLSARTVPSRYLPTCGSGMNVSPVLFGDCLLQESATNCCRWSP